MYLSVLKSCNFWTDSGKGDFELFYLRNKDKQEIDFLIVRDGEPWLPVEVKTGSTSPSPNWRRFLPDIGCKRALQITDKPIRKLYSEEDTDLLITNAADALIHFV